MQFPDGGTLSFASVYQGGRTDSDTGPNPNAATGTSVGNLIEQGGGAVSRALGLELPVLVGFAVLAFVLVLIYGK